MEEDSDAYLRLQIAYIYCDVGANLSWFAVHCLMLTIFVKYGKPMEDNEKTLIENKLLEMFQETQDEELKQKRKFKAYQDMADLQVKEIIRTMRAYTAYSDQGRTTPISSTPSSPSGLIDG